MKKNAIIRIVVWSFVILCLTSILLGGLGFRSVRNATAAMRSSDIDLVPAAIGEESPAETIGMESPSAPEQANTAGKCTVYSAPSEDASQLGNLKEGETVQVAKKENVAGEDWAFISQPVQGWIRTKHLESAPQTTAPTTSPSVPARERIYVYATPQNENPQGYVENTEDIVISKQENINGQGWAYITEPVTGWIITDDENSDGFDSFPPNAFRKVLDLNTTPIHGIEIDWVAGDIQIQTADVDSILVDVSQEQVDKPVVISVDEGELQLQYCQKKQMNSLIGMHLNEKEFKNLTITVPRDWICRDLDIDAAAANLVVNDMRIGEVNFDSATGICDFNECQISQLELETASGDVFFSGELQELDGDAVSANITAILYNTPRSIEVDSMSGNLEVTLPEDTGFQLRLQAMSSNWVSDFETEARNGAYFHGDGKCRITVNAFSGQVILRKG